MSSAEPFKYTQHSPANIDKMSHGIPLTDVDRAPWLAAIHARLVDVFERGQDLVVACSALEQQYRKVLAENVSISGTHRPSPSPDANRSRAG
jgi:carbohydrate kinase (thermoresistant glucokinase family)